MEEIPALYYMNDYKYRTIMKCPESCVICNLESVKNEITSSVQRFVPNVILNDVRVVQSDDDRAEIFVRMDYTIKEGNRITKDSIITQI